MKKLDLGDVAQIVSNVGVIAGIIFLGIELRQNNEFLATDVRYTRATQRQRGFELLIENPALRTAMAKKISGQQLTVEEEMLFGTFLSHNLTGIELEWYEYRAGHIDSLPIENMRQLAASIQGLDEWWQAQKSFYDPEFVKWAEENLILPTN
jgi:hypothetical protein